MDGKTKCEKIAIWEMREKRPRRKRRKRGGSDMGKKAGWGCVRQGKENTVCSRVQHTTDQREEYKEGARVQAEKQYEDLVAVSPASSISLSSRAFCFASRCSSCNLCISSTNSCLGKNRLTSPLSTKSSKFVPCHAPRSRYSSLRSHAW